MQRLIILASLGLVLPLVAVLPGLATGAPPDKSTVVQLVRAGVVTSPAVIDYRWADLAQNGYAQTYVDTYTYDDATVTVSYETGEPTFTGHLSAVNLKPNFAYQVKLVGKPTGLWGTEGDDASNERIGYAGRWWEVAPGVGNRNDAYYETYKDNPAYIFESYLLFDFFLTDSVGSAELDFALDSSYHVLFWDWQGSQGSCDNPLKTTTVSGLSTDPAYDANIGPTEVGVYPQIERLCDGQTALSQNAYLCRILLTEESFHTADGNWAPAMVYDDIQFNIGAGLFPPTMIAEPAFTAGSDNTVSWNSVTGAIQYYVECSTAPDFGTVHPTSGWIAGLSQTFAGLVEGQIYYYRVKASNGSKLDSAWSATVFSTQDATAPASSVGSLPGSYTGYSLSIPYTASDVVSGVDFVELHYRVDGGAYAQYGGTFSSSPIDFVIPGDGDYDFYTVATDNAGNPESPPGSPDASSVLTVNAAPNPVGNCDYIDIGTLASENQTVMGEAPYNMLGWGPTAPGTIGGNYGGISPGSCRPVWSPTEYDLPHEPWADIDLDFGPVEGTKTLWVRYLDGASTDDQSYYINGSLIGSIETGDPGENWYWHSFDVSSHVGSHTLRIEATESAGSYWNPYGQVAIDILSICGAAALFEALPVDADPIGCGQSKQVDFHFTQGCEYIRGYSIRVQSNGGLSFDNSNVTVLDPSGTGDVTSTVTQNAVDDWTITYSINGDSALPFGIPSDSDLFTIDFQGVSDGTGQVLIESVTVDPIDLVPPPVLNSVGATITVDCSAPAAVTALTAEPGNLKIFVTWQDPSDADLTSLEIWRGFWYDDDLGGASAYPEYGGLPNDVVPTRPLSRAGALASPEWELAGTVQPGEEAFTDVDGPGGLVRGIYYYEVFAADAEGLYGPRATGNGPATSYLLGDIDGDGAITIGPDITAGLSLCYGTHDGDAGYNNECDVGPTDDYTGVGIPQPDDIIGFDDLMIMAVNFDAVFTKSPAGTDVFARFAWTEVEADAWSLGLVEPCADLKGLNLKADLPAGTVLSLSAGELLAGQDCPVFLRNIDRNGLDTGLALLSDGARIRGKGELLRVTVAEGHVPANVAVDARDSRNAAIPCEVETATAIPGMPVLHQAFPNYPNPFKPATRIEFDLPGTETVELSVFGLDGRWIVTLVGGTLPAGRHAVTWTGRDHRGEIVAAGTYVYRLKAGSYTKTCKMTFLK
ncbi:MAG: hypothetical protein KAY32_13655 [Candidatus Eisenbacteria sp.]|nr:hypothetical protein [Candidatus Eisenbacteria bacterium]